MSSDVTPDTVLSAACPPLLKWPGGKRELLPQIAPLLQLADTARYFEPFFGGGAVFFALQPKRAWLSDADVDLMNCYEQVRDNVEVVLDRLRRLPNTAEDYYRIRATRPSSPASRAARSIYLSTLSFNGIHRRNQSGDFNVPYGYRTHLRPADGQRLRRISAALEGRSILSSDFEDAVHHARADDVVYLDPPYTVAHGNNGFVKYNAKIFSWQDQERLADVAKRLRKIGCRVVISNAHHETILALYKDFKVARVRRPSCIAADVTHRKTITECLFY
jgi:DNA adenine methylase